MQTIYTNKELALQRAKESMGKSFGDINQIIIDRGGKDGLSNTKGGLGNILQEGWFNIPANSFAEADLEEAGLEIKVTGYKPDVRNGGFKAKERLVCNIINYETENLDDFYQSSFWQKNKSILLSLYAILCKLPSSQMAAQAVIKVYRKPIHGQSPILNRHRPFLRRIHHRQINHLTSRII